MKRSKTKSRENKTDWGRMGRKHGEMDAIHIANNLIESDELHLRPTGSWIIELAEESARSFNVPENRVPAYASAYKDAFYLVFAVFEEE